MLFGDTIMITSFFQLKLTRYVSALFYVDGKNEISVEISKDIEFPHRPPL